MLVDIKDASKELISFKNDFELSTGIKVDGLIESKSYFHWKRLAFQSLDCDQMFKIATYIKRRFSTPGIFTHLSVNLVSFEGVMCLTTDVDRIKEFIIK